LFLCAFDLSFWILNLKLLYFKSLGYIHRLSKLIADSF
jgi:hypothetical protein